MNRWIFMLQHQLFSAGDAASLNHPCFWTGYNINKFLNPMQEFDDPNRAKESRTGSFRSPRANDAAKYYIN